MFKLIVDFMLFIFLVVFENVFVKIKINIIKIMFEWFVFFVKILIFLVNDFFWFINNVIIIVIVIVIFNGIEVKLFVIIFMFKNNVINNNKGNNV